MKKLIRAAITYEDLSPQDIEQNCVNYFRDCLNRYFSSESESLQYDIESKLEMSSQLVIKSGLTKEYNLDIYVDFDGNKYNIFRVDAHIIFFTDENNFLCFGDCVAYVRPSYDPDDNSQYYYSPGPLLQYKPKLTFDQMKEAWKESRMDKWKSSTIHYNIEEVFPYSSILKLLSNAKKKYEKQKVNLSKSKSWNSLVRNLKDEIEEGLDPLYEETESGERLWKLCYDVMNELNLYIDSDVRGGVGNIYIMSIDNEDVISDPIDLQEFHTEILDEAIQSNSTESKFKSWFKQYLKNMIG